MIIQFQSSRSTSLAHQRYLTKEIEKKLYHYRGWIDHVVVGLVEYEVKHQKDHLTLVISMQAEGIGTIRVEEKNNNLTELVIVTLEQAQMTLDEIIAGVMCDDEADYHLNVA